jgi:hypothetical protein
MKKDSINCKELTFNNFNQNGNTIDLYFLVDDIKITYSVSISKVFNILSCKLDRYIFLLGLNLLPCLISRFRPKKIKIKAGYLDEYNTKYWIKIYNKLFDSHNLPKINKIIIDSDRKFKASTKLLKNKVLLLNNCSVYSCIASKILKINEFYFEWLSINPDKHDRLLVEISKRPANYIETKYDEKEVNNYKKYNMIDLNFLEPSLMTLVAASKEFKFCFGCYQRTTICKLQKIVRYSKSVNYEIDFNNYFKLNVDTQMKYCNITQPFYLLQACKIFSRLYKYYAVILENPKTDKFEIYLNLYLFMSKTLDKYHSNYLNNKFSIKSYENLVGIEHKNKLYNNQSYDTLEKERNNMMAIYMISKKRRFPFIINHFTKNYSDLLNHMEQYEENYFLNFGEEGTIPNKLYPKITYAARKIIDDPDFKENFNFKLSLLPKDIIFITSLVAISLFLYYKKILYFK